MIGIKQNIQNSKLTVELLPANKQQVIKLKYDNIHYLPNTNRQLVCAAASQIGSGSVRIWPKSKALVFRYHFRGYRVVGSLYRVRLCSYRRECCEDKEI